MLTGIIVGITIGVFGCVLLYLSGNVPPLNPTGAALPIAANTPAPASLGEEQVDGGELELEFYRELPIYEVSVDATPVELTPAQSGESVAINYMLQTGAFLQRELAELEAQRQQQLGLEAFIETEQLRGRTFHLLLSGPYTDSRQLNVAEQTLRRNNIPGQRMRVN